MELLKKHSNLVTGLLTAVITGILAIAANLVLIQPQNRSADAELIAQLIDRVSVLEASQVSEMTRFQQLQAENTQLLLKIGALELAATTDLDYIDVMCSLIEARPGLNWVKVYSEGEFRMLCLSSAYAASVGVSRLQYIGYTDFDVWPEEIAQGFYDNDYAVYNSRSFIQQQESWLENGAQVMGLVTKFYFRYQDQEFIVGHAGHT